MSCEAYQDASIYVLFTEHAPMVEKRFKKAWKRADVTLAGSRFMGEAHASVTITGSVGSGY